MDLKEKKVLENSSHNHWYYRCKALALDKLLSGLTFHTLLDVGAGSGIFTRHLLTSVTTAICVDPGYELEDMQKFLDGKAIRFSRNIGEQEADLVLLMDVLEHVEDDIKLLRSTMLCATRGAYVVITVPAFQSLFSAHDIFLGHKRRYTRGQLEAVIRLAGLEIVTTRYFFAFLLPGVAILRVLRRSSPPASDLRVHSWVTNEIMYLLHRLELLMFSRNRFAGLTVFCLARKP